MKSQQDPLIKIKLKQYSYNYFYISKMIMIHDTKYLTKLANSVLMK